jgi:PAS domain-containing protein
MLLGLVIAGGSATSVLGALMIFAGITRHRTPPVFSPEIEEQDAVFVFRGDDLVDCSDRGRKLLDGLRDLHPDPLNALLTFLQPRFRNLRARLADVAALGRLDLSADDGSGLSISARFRAGLVHMRVIDPTDEGALMAMDRLSFQALDDELQTLRKVTQTAPVVIWQQDADGQIVWANDAYLDTLAVKAGERAPLTWPLPSLFPRPDLPDTGADRLMLDLDSGQRWFAHQTHPMGKATLHFATPIDSTVQSELARREMMQMLTRTFASLPIGLALFDAERRLQVFNPALVDLTGLDPFFLAARPDLAQFLHTLRELRMLPEPKDFSTWRDELIRMETAAASGTYNEEWALQDGSIYQVTGCPQPNGAIAFFIQDITSEATLLRGIRAEVDFTATVLDALPDAVIAFDRTGAVTLVNAAYVQLWGGDPSCDLADGGFAQAAGLWNAACDIGPALARLSEYVAQATPQSDPFAATTTLRNGGPLAIQAEFLAAGGLVVCFRPLHSDARPVARRALGDLVSTHLMAPDMAAAQVDFPDLPLRPRGRSVRHAGPRLRV